MVYCNLRHWIACEGVGTTRFNLCRQYILCEAALHCGEKTKRQREAKLHSCRLTRVHEHSLPSALLHQRERHTPYHSVTGTGVIPSVQ
ncbi:hypothetical protein AALO_G00076670 [Alosa alosa]|uniref:Uncharacterized protein n=1 Tax=Alosa alosa TaxID=278164 RepID=A0AAV6GWA9_9TELE|nr:hypothetical protein AALO_G00076670 [Alosa alosa]